MSNLKAVGRRNSPLLGGESVFVFCLGLHGLDETHPLGGGQSTLFNLPNKMIISSKNILTDTPRIMFDQVSGFLRPSQVDT